ncbi:autotransporter domain-containing protein [Thermomonas sp.]|uniref:autotransporter outer membrane beta-barrel domain-containing protein n=1 Tax=Thermomonas sp. TaxID=1971895 RepID=UPI002B707D46|nr:autotransporter domain-containing protein [Thermomonas sp.]HRO63451.1 autotransporter domain-containing protein [Thermomonas sp.]
MKHRKTSIATALASIAIPTALAIASPAAQAQSATPANSPYAGLFDNMVVYGDSFSDGGNFSLAMGYPEGSRFTTNPGLVAVEYFAHYFGMPLAASEQGGGNYAFAFASVREPSPGVPSLPEQLAMSLQANGGKADPRTLYTIVGGANDVFTNFTSVGMGLLTPEEAAANLKLDAQAELDMLHQLEQAGARYVMVFNLPDLGLSPDIVALGPDVAAQLTEMTRIYNDALNAGLGNTGLNVIPVNTFGLFSEFVADPSRYGLGNVADAACGAGSLAVDCGPQGSGMPYTYAPGTEMTYLFADFGHPGTAAHKMLAKYAQSIVIAPGQMSLLGEAPLQFGNDVQHGALDQAVLRPADASSGWRPWIRFSHMRDRFDAQVNSPANRAESNTLSIGADIQASPTLTAGLAVSLGRQRDAFAGNAGGFRLDDTLGTGYLAWRSEHAFAGIAASYGQLRFRDIHRNVAIGPDLRRERGDTSGTQAALTLTGGWWFDMGTWKTGPFADLSWQRIRIDGHAEAGNASTAMWFGRQQRQAMIGSLGWQLAARLPSGSKTLYPYARIAWHHDAKADPRLVSAGLVSMAGSFALQGYSPDRNWASVDLGLGCDFSPNLSGWIGYSGRFADASQRRDSVNLGLRFQF